MLQVLHTEMFFDPQVHTLRGVEFTTFMPGFVKAIRVRPLASGTPPARFGPVDLISGYVRRQVGEGTPLLERP